MTRWTLALLAVASVGAAACSPKDSAPADQATTAAQGSGDDLADVASYKLSMDKVDKFFAAQRNMALKAKDMSPAQQEEVSMDGSGSMADMAKQIESSPEWSAAIREAGLEPREYVTLTMSMLQSAMAASVLKMRPNDDQDSLVREMKASMDNVRFIQEHEAEITAKREAMEKELNAMGGGEES